MFCPAVGLGPEVCPLSGELLQVRILSSYGEKIEVMY